MQATYILLCFTILIRNLPVARWLWRRQMVEGRPSGWSIDDLHFAREYPFEHIGYPTISIYDNGHSIHLPFEHMTFIHWIQFADG